MHSFTTLVAATTLASIALAKPVPAPAVTPKQGWTVTPSVAKALPAPAVQIRKIYQKYGIAVPEDVASAAESGSVVTTPEQYDVEYLAPVTIGGQTVNLDFDTGSADLWVFSNQLSASETSGHSIYDPESSESSQLLQGETWNITYGDGSGASGTVYTDDVEIGGVTVTGQAVEIATQISAQFAQDQDNDGLLGLAFSAINTVTPNQQTTWFDTGISQGAFESNVFTVDLKKGTPGTYDFGFIDDSKYTGSITYTPVNSANGFWEFTGTGYAVGSGSFKKSSIDAIADTGTTLLLMDDAIVSAYYKKVSGATYDSSQGGYVFPCSTTPPNFVLGIGSGKATIPGSYMNLAPASGSNCFGGLQSNSGIGFSIYGDIFLKAVFAVFDSDNTQFGFAAKDL